MEVKKMKNFRQSCKALLVMLTTLVSLCLFLEEAKAIPSSQALYFETQLAPSLWEYDYLLYNTSDPIVDAGYDIFDFTLFFDPLAGISGISDPTDWIDIAGAGFIDWFSISPGAPPLGADIAPGAFLGGFSFTSDLKLGDLLYEVTFTNPLDPFNPLVQSSTSTLIPEPATLLLVGSGIVGLGIIRRRIGRGT
jgi:hypothetical protein